MSELAVVQFSVADVRQMAVAIAQSGLFGVKTTEQAFGLMLVAQAEGRHPATVAQEYDIIQGRPALKAQAALARFQAAGGCIRWLERGPAACAAEFSHPQGGVLAIRWDMARAQAAQLTGKENWRKFPAQMLSARVVAEGVRAVFPACLKGVYLAEEVQDFDAPRRDAAQEVQPTAEQFIPYEKAMTLAGRATAAGFEDAQIESAIGADPARVTIAKAKAFFAIVEAEERANEPSEDAQGVPEQA